MMEKLYTKEEVAEKLHISLKTLSNKMSAREITYIKGRPCLFTESAFKAYLRKRTQKAVA